MATTTPNFGWPVPTSTDLVKDGATAIEGLGDAIDASLLDLKGGTSGQVLKKNSNTDMDFVWSADSAGMTNPMTTTGDTIYSSSGSTPARLGIGSSGQVLTVAGGVPTWATPAAGGGGKILQVVSFSTTTATTKTGTGLVDTNITASITPSASTSKILVLSTLACQMYTSGNYNQVGMGMTVVRGGTTIYDNTAGGGNEGWYFTNSTTTYHQLSSLQTINYVDSPATTSATTYKIQIGCSYASGTVKTSDNSRPSTLILMEIGA